jgi:N-methylhydantoinase B
VLRDVIDGKVSAAAALEDYGVVLRADNDADAPSVDEAATKQLRDKRRAGQGSPAIIDRGEGFEKMLRGEFKPWVRSA